ncbi:MAG: Grx4 family monothiol glutaredoxin [Mariprofundaceae bacterium]|nr:Grx4 family monothiol glutaredoxin [Mariprofundaceae bacterium]
MKEVLKQIDDVVKNNAVVLFMKGTPDFPQCGFSQRVAAILADSCPSYTAINVLLDDHVREGIKKYADWPTIPQLYINGAFVGGCDIIIELHENGELTNLLQQQPAD